MAAFIERVLIDRARIAQRVRELGTHLAADLAAEGVDDGGGGGGGAEGRGRIVLIPILTGSIVFVADLIREMPLKLSLGVVAVSSYPGKSMASKGAAIRGELPTDLRGRHVIIVDDILDSGQTLALVKQLVQEQQPASVRVCVLLRKIKEGAEGGGVAGAAGHGGNDGDQFLRADYVGFEIPDEFVVGYGLDYDGYYRNHPEIVTLRRDAL